MSQFDTSGRLAVNGTGASNFHLVIHEARHSDAGRYACSVDSAFEKQHITVVRVRGK